jgi:hypothetical protein
MKYQEWQKKVNRFVAMTGYTVEKFMELLPSFKEAHANQTKDSAGKTGEFMSFCFYSG